MMKNVITRFLLFLNFIFLQFACEAMPDANIGLPVVETSPVQLVASDYSIAIGGGVISSNGGYPITASGLVWSTQRHPDINTNEGITTDGPNLGSFTSVMSPLAPGTYYFVKAYATNAYGTSYGRELVFYSQTGPYDGRYSLSFTNVHPLYNPTGLGATVDVEMWTTGPNKVKIYWPDRGGFYNPAILNGSLTYFQNQEPEYTIDPNNYSVTVQNSFAGAGTFYSMYSGYNSYYDTAARKIFCKWGYSNFTRLWTQEFTYLGPRNSNGSNPPVVLHSFTPSSGTSGTVLTLKGLNFSTVQNNAYVGNTFTIGGTFNGITTTKIADSIAIVSDSVMKVWIGYSPVNANDTLYFQGDYLPGFNYSEPPAVTSPGWQYFGTPGFKKYPVKINFDNNNVPFAVYLDSATRKLYVAKYTNNNWTNIGGAISSGYGSNAKIIFDNNNTPIVSFVDSVNGNRITVKANSGSFWFPLGTPGFCGGLQSNDQYLYANQNNDLYLFGLNYATTTVSSPSLNIPIPDVNASGVTNGINISNIPPNAKILGMDVKVNIPHSNCGELLIYLKAPNGKILALDKYMEGFIYGQNQFYPTQGFINTTFSSASGTILYYSRNNSFTGLFGADANDWDGNIDPSICPISNPTGFVSDALNLNELYTTPNGNWTLVVADGLNDGTYDQNAHTGYLASWSMSFKYIINGTVDSTIMTKLYKFDGSDWVSQGQTVISDDPGDYYYGLAFNKLTSEAFISYSYNDSVKSVKYNGTEWSNLPSLGIENSFGAYYASCALDKDGHLMVCFQDDDGFERLSAYVLNNNLWSPLGPLKFSKSRVHAYQMIADKKGNPYVIFTDEGYNESATVMTYNAISNTWNNVGARAAIPYGININPIIAFDTASVPYVSFYDKNYSNKASVMRLSPPSTIQGTCLTPLGDSIPYVSMRLSGGVILDTVTTIKGKFNIPAFTGGNYVLTPSKNNDINRSNGVSTLDIIKIQSHILNIDTLNSPYKIIAADVNGSGSVTGLDILYIRKLILGISNTFPNNRLWAFVDAAQTFSNAYNPFPYNASKSFTSLTSLTGQNFRGMKLGDVTYDWNPTILKGNERKKIQLYADTILYENNDTVRMYFKADHFYQIQGMQFTLGWNASNLHFVGVGANDLNVQFGTTRAEEGLLSVLWNDPMNIAKTLSGGDGIFELKFIKTNPITDDVISIGGEITPVEGYDAALDFHDVVLTGAYIKGQQSTMPVLYSANSVYPNPSTGIIQVDFESPVEQLVSIRLINQSGQSLGLKYQQMIRGRNQIKLDLRKQMGAVSNGNYYLKLTGYKINKTYKINLVD